jgi:putative MATE family efflux protein
VSSKQRVTEVPQREITWRLIQLAWPIVGLNMLQVLALAVDTAMVGRTPNAEAALTGMGYASQLVFLLMVAMIGLTVSTVAFIARAKGANDMVRVRHILQQSVQLTACLGIAVAIVGNLLAVPLLQALGANATTMDPALSYFRPLLLGTAFNYLNLLLAAALRGVGDTRLAFFVALALNGLNVLFNYGLILGNFGLPALGITGAAIGTVAAQACAVALMLWFLQRRTVPEFHLTARWVPVDRELLRSLLRVGWPAATDMFVLNAAFLSIVGMLGRIDQAAVAAHAIGLRVQALAFVPGLSVSQAIGALVGQSLGAHDVDGAKRVFRSGVWLSVAVMGTLGLILIVFAGPIVVLFGVRSGSQLHAYSIMWMELLGYAMPIVGVFIALTGVLRGSGATMTSLRINAVTTFAAQIPGSYVLGFIFGLEAWGVWVAFPLTFGIKAAWGMVAYRRGQWARTGT